MQAFIASKLKSGCHIGVGIVKKEFINKQHYRIKRTLFL